MNTGHYFFLFCWVLALTPTLSPKSQAQSLTAQQKAGKKVYTEGMGNSSVEITANMSGIAVSATIMKCVNCHNERGTGNAEGGIIPSNITWSQLTKSYGGRRLDGKTYPAYDERLLRKVITTGIDPGGNVLHSAMPRYNMTREDLDNLIAYLKIIGNDQVPGVTTSGILIGFILDDQGTSNAKNEAIRKVVNAYCEKINSNGGLYNRKIEIRFLTREDSLAEKGLFMVTGYGSGAISNQNTVIPALFMNSERLAPGGINNESTFYVYPSLEAQSLSLVDFSIKQNFQAADGDVAIVYAGDNRRKIIADRVAAYYSSMSGISPKMIALEAHNLSEIADSKHISNGSLLFFIGPFQSGNQLVELLDKKGKQPCILTPGSVSGLNLLDLPPGLQDRVFVSYPTWATQRSAGGLLIYQNLEKEYDLSPGWKNSQFDALIMLLTLEECLKQTGRNLTPEKMVGTLEKMHQFPTGLSQPLTYDVNQRVGTSSVYIAGYDTENKTLKLISTINSWGD